METADAKEILDTLETGDYEPYGDRCEQMILALLDDGSEEGVKAEGTITYEMEHADPDSGSFHDLYYFVDIEFPGHKVKIDASHIDMLEKDLKEWVKDGALSEGPDDCGPEYSPDWDYRA